MHVLPQSKIPVAKIPLDFMISSKIKYRKKHEKAVKSKGGYLPNAVEIHARDTEAQRQGMILIDEFKFPHCVFLLGKNELNSDGCKFAYEKMSKFMKLDERPSLGVTIILAQEWMFMAPIETAYHLETQLDIPGAKLEDGVPVYLDGFAYSGILSMQNICQ